MTDKSEQATPEMVNQAVAETLADLVVVTATSAKAEPRVAAAMNTLQTLIAQLVALTLGVNWAADNDSLVQDALSSRITAIKARVQDIATNAQANG